MNILFFSSNSPYWELDPSFKNYGGAEMNLRIIAEEFSKLNHNSYYYSVKKWCSLKKNINGVNIFIKPIFYIPILHKFFPFINKFNKKLILRQHKKYIQFLIKKYKINIIHTYATYPDTYVSIKASRKYKIPVLQRIGGRAWYNLLKENSSLREETKWTFSNVDMMLFITNFLKNLTYDHLHKLDFKVNSKSEVLDIGINYEILNKINLDLVKNKYNLNETENIVLCIESFKPYSKRQDIIIESLNFILKKIQNIKIIFIGKGPFLKKMKEFAIKLDVNKKILFLGEIPHEDVLAMISISKIVVHPTEFEGLSTVMKETMALGKTFLVSNIKSIYEIIKDGYTGVVSENKPEIFAEKIIYLLTNESVRKKIELNAANYAKEYFNSKKNILLYEKVFLDIISE